MRFVGSNCQVYYDHLHSRQSSDIQRRPGTDLGSARLQATLVFGAPRKCDLFGRLSEKRESMPLLCVVSAQKSIFCCADFGSTITLDLQQKLKPFLYSSKEQMLFLEFIALSCSSEVLFVKLPISRVFCKFIFRIYTFSCGTVLPPLKISSSCRYVKSFCKFIFWIYTFSCGTVLPPLKISSSCRYVNSFFIVTVTTYFMNQTSTIH